MLMMGTLISISSYSWMGMWIGLEINLLSILPLMTSYKNMMSSEATLKYFLTQAMASTILLFVVILFSMNSLMKININSLLILIFNSSLLTKMGAAPFHFWFPEVIEGLSWMNSLIMLTWQKLAPMVIIMYNFKLSLFFMLIIIFCMLTSGIQGLNQISIRKILAYSSINHLGWMLSSMLFFESIWMIYFFIYTITSMNLVIIFYKNNIFYLKQLFNNLNNNLLIKLIFMFNFMSLGGLPPFLGFLPKWLTIQELITNNMYMLTFIMMVMTLMTLYFYIRIMFSTLILSMNEINFKLYLNLNSIFIFFINLMSIMGLMFCSMIFINF
uniref:NADH-ubiquinone oxidoreductase chain 2 n=1 Tax=Eusphalerum torquatum TaxID=878013 RepID=A0A0S2M7A3_9COLE|nr:NADH deshydrogenase subunit 2 [Eusphalerum torquatum]